MVQNAVLATVCVAGVIAVAGVAPQALILLKHMGITPSRRHPESIKRAIASLVQKEYLVWRDGKVQVTAKGRAQFALEESIRQVRMKKRRWDGKWRVLIFDIPERRRTVRQRVRLELLRIGFVRLQDSVWVYPYECEELVALLKIDMKIGPNLLYMIVDTIEGDTSLRNHFKLSMLK
jgi:DNA-binding transcriptional regulator PaaX